MKRGLWSTALCIEIGWPSIVRVQPGDCCASKQTVCGIDDASLSVATSGTGFISGNMDPDSLVEP